MNRWFTLLGSAIILSLLLVHPAAAQDAADECSAPPGIAPAVYFVGQGDAHAASAQHARAIVDYTCALAADPNYAPAYARRAVSQSALGDADAALADYDAALAIDETLVEVYINRGMFYAQAGNFGLALADLSLALSLEPGNAIALNNRAVVHAIEGNYDLALADLETATTQHPDNPVSYATLGSIYSALAVQNYQRYLEVSGSDEAPLPAGTPTQMLSALDNGLRTGNYSVWLGLMRPADWGTP